MKALSLGHHNPLGLKSYLSTQHVERYRFACSRLQQGMNVLDIASGAGYGTAMLAWHGCVAVGGDLDDDALETARDTWKKCSFVKADALDLPFENSSFDAVVSFETIEHVENGLRFLSEMRRVLRPGGIFICSTPNTKYTFPGKGCHVKEYLPFEFYELVMGEFSDAQLFAQYIRARDRLKDLSRRHIKFPAINAGLYLLERLRLKEIVKKVLFGGNHPALKRNWFPDSPEQWLKDVTASPPVAVYSVKPFYGERLLRIMVTTCRK